MKYRWDIINRFIAEYNYKSYLEIGVRSKTCYKRINIEHKACVDPAKETTPTFCLTSDNFFKQNKSTFDIIFIDGLHLCEQVERDILNSLDFLNNKGTIICHDMNPINETHQIRQYNGGTWNGDVWKAWVKLRSKRSDLNMYVVDTDHGIGVIRKGKQDVIKSLPEKLTYKDLVNNRKQYLNLITLKEFINSSLVT